MATLFGPGAMGLPMFGAESKTKVEDGKAYRKGDFAYTPDDIPSHWKLRLTNAPGGKPDPHIVGAAVAALGKGFRGNKVDIPRADLAQVKRRVLRAWHAANPGKDSDVPDVLKHLDAGMEGVAPPGWKHSVEKMKNDTSIDNPFALAWWMQNRGAKPAQHKEMSASAEDVTLLRSLLRQQHQIPPLCVAAARGEAWAHAQLLAVGCPQLGVEGRW